MCNVRAQANLPAILCIAITFLFAFPPAKAQDALSGATLATHCRADMQAPSNGYCKAYFQGVLDTLNTTTQATDQPTYCVPHDLHFEGLIGLYLSESRLYPEVLDTPASRLIFGMLLKFFPCLRAQAPARLPSHLPGYRQHHQVDVPGATVRSGAATLCSDMTGPHTGVFT